MTAAFCGGDVCAARVQFWLATPDDDGISDPCPRCLRALADMFGLPAPSAPRPLIDLYHEVSAP